MQAWSDKINNVLLLVLAPADAATNPIVPAFSTSLNSTSDTGFISAIIQCPAQPSMYFVQARESALVPGQHVCADVLHSPCMVTMGGSACMCAAACAQVRRDCREPRIVDPLVEPLLAAFAATVPCQCLLTFTDMRAWHRAGALERIVACAGVHPSGLHWSGERDLQRAGVRVNEH